MLLESYLEGTEVTLDFATADPSLQVELLDDDGVHNKRFRVLPSSHRLVRFVLLPNPNAKAHKTHDDRVALRYEGPWMNPTVYCEAFLPPPASPAPPGLPPTTALRRKPLPPAIESALSLTPDPPATPAFNKGGLSGFSVTESLGASHPPSDLSPIELIKEGTCTSIILGWKPPHIPEGIPILEYMLKVIATSGDGRAYPSLAWAIDGIVDTQHSVTGLNPGVSYSFTLHARNIFGWSQPSAPLLTSVESGISHLSPPSPNTPLSCQSFEEERWIFKDWVIFAVLTATGGIAAACLFAATCHGFSLALRAHLVAYLFDDQERITAIRHEEARAITGGDDFCISDDDDDAAASSEQIKARELFWDEGDTEQL